MSLSNGSISGKSKGIPNGIWAAEVSHIKAVIALDSDKTPSLMLTI